ncbi:MAG: hypothetical protein CL521_06315 [Actinobacteria bacterium]|nr:hypothetical protein [Actinomycetota bacterium]|tara:strand:+ start:737 stop:1192 length:456 start_codon:yes stop_codon:yes gene_type:complete
MSIWGRNIKQLLLAGVVVLLWSSILSAHFKGNEKGMNERQLQKISQKMDLNNDQQQELERILARRQKQRQEHQSTMKQIKTQFDQALSEDPVDISTLNTLKAQILAHQEKRMDLKVQETQALQDLLSPEQFKHFQKVQKKKWKKHRKKAGY